MSIAEAGGGDIAEDGAAHLSGDEESDVFFGATGDFEGVNCQEGGEEEEADTGKADEEEAGEEGRAPGLSGDIGEFGEV